MLYISAYRETYLCKYNMWIPIRSGSSSSPDSVNHFDNGTLKITELFSIAHSSGIVCLKRLNGFMLDFMFLLVMGVADHMEVGMVSSS